MITLNTTLERLHDVLSRAVAALRSDQPAGDRLAAANGITADVQLHLDVLKRKFVDEFAVLVDLQEAVQLVALATEVNSLLFEWARLLKACMVEVVADIAAPLGAEPLRDVLVDVLSGGRKAAG